MRVWPGALWWEGIEDEERVTRDWWPSEVELLSPAAMDISGCNILAVGSSVIGGCYTHHTCDASGLVLAVSPCSRRLDSCGLPSPTQLLLVRRPGLVVSPNDRTSASPSLGGGS